MYITFLCVALTYYFTFTYYWLSHNCLREMQVKYHALEGSCNRFSSQTYTDIKVFRIGRKTAGLNRRLRVTLSTPNDVVAFLKSTARYTGPYKFSNDRTKKQRDNLRDLKLELNKLTQNGDANKTIRYIHGVPIDLQCALSALSTDYDDIIFTETWLTSHFYSSELGFIGYDIHRL